MSNVRLIIKVTGQIGVCFQRGYPELLASGKAGGAIVYASRGNYLFAGHINVPSGVTLGDVVAGPARTPGSTLYYYCPLHIHDGPTGNLDSICTVLAVKFTTAFRYLEGVERRLLQPLRPVRNKCAVR